MPDKRFKAMESELKDAIKEFKIYMRDQQGFKDKPLEHLMRGVTRFGPFLVGRAVVKGEQVPLDWRA